MRVKGICLFHNIRFGFTGSYASRLVDEVGEVVVFWDYVAKKVLMGYGRGGSVSYLW